MEFFRATKLGALSQPIAHIFGPVSGKRSYSYILFIAQSRTLAKRDHVSTCALSVQYAIYRCKLCFTPTPSLATPAAKIFVADAVIIRPDGLLESKFPGQLSYRFEKWVIFEKKAIFEK